MIRLLFFAGSTREGSFNKKLAALGHHIAEANGIEAVLVDLKDYPMPIYNGDLEAKEGPPERARAFKALLEEYQGVFIASPEYNSSVTPLLKNTIDWISRVREGREASLTAFKQRVFALGATSNGTYGGMRSLMALRQVLELGCGALVLPEQIVVREAAQAFDERDNLKDERSAGRLKALAQRLVESARQLA